MRHLPNFLTLLRVAAAPFIAWLLAAQDFRPALAVSILAGLTDWLDGFAARRLRVSGKTGAVLDPAADKTLLVTLFIVLGVIGQIPLWMVALVIARDVIIVTGALLLRIFRGVRRFRPAPLGKVSTFFQIVLVLLVLVRSAYPNRFDVWLALIALILSALFTAVSGGDYIHRGILMARRRLPAPS